ncbi:hypothetical protein K503DRAFT_170573 [Rhizopogon vinicolor AM-OR11-026]|uniref:Uncharacterized protein n=1 Tax=Rhizopogon vinicolor AM-OR11-026 TaxID=1314800 RepID=A0A1B7N0E6_9AGAM|nr:hypothetical protein K503DRAFT_170573 [Rhizopogon vinicolor AM-OR11-026]
MVSAPSFSKIPQMNVSFARDSNKAVPGGQCNRQNLINLKIKRISSRTPAFYFPGSDPLGHDPLFELYRTEFGVAENPYFEGYEFDSLDFEHLKQSWLRCR